MDLEEMLNYASHELEPQARVLLATWEQLPLLLPLPCARRLPLCAVVCVAQQPVCHVLTGPCFAPACRPAPHPRSNWPCASCATGAALPPHLLLRFTRLGPLPAATCCLICCARLATLEKHITVCLLCRAGLATSLRST